MAKNSRIQLIVSAKDQASRVFNQVRAKLKSLKDSVFSLKTGIAALVGAVGIGTLGKSFLDAAVSTENYQARLKILLGSQKEGNRLFKEMSDYAAKVPFEYDQIMGSATQLAGILKGGVDEIKEWMPLIGDLAAASGLDIQTTTEQVSRMLSAGAASADLFQQRGINAFLGFKQGVSYTAEETRKQLMEQWKKTDSGFRGATDAMANTWDGMMSMLSDAWFNFRQMVMDSGVFDGLKAGVQGVLDKLKELNTSGKLKDLAKGFGENVMAGIKTVLGALPGIVRGAVKAAEALVLAVSGFTQIKGLFEVLFKQVQIWSLEFINELRLVFIHLLEGIGSIPGVDTSGAIKATYQDIGETFQKIDGKGGLAEQLEGAKVKLGQIQIKQDETIARMEEAGKAAADAVKVVADGALSGMEEGYAKMVKGSKEATDAQIADVSRLIAKYRELGQAMSFTIGNGGTTVTVEKLADQLDQEADR